MPLTVADVLALDSVTPAQPVVLAGESGLGRTVRWVHITEQPDIAGYLKGGELLLTTGINLVRDHDLPRRFVEELAGVGVAGLLVRLGAAFDALPDPMLAAAERVGLPLIALRRRIPFVDVTEQVHAEIVRRQTEVLHKAQEIRSEFTGLLLGGSRVADIVRRLAQLLDRPVVLEDIAHQVLAYAAGADDDERLDDLLASWERHSRGPHEPAEDGGQRGVQARIVGNPPSCAWLPIPLHGELHARLHVLEPTGSRPFDEVDLLAIDRAGTGVGLALLVERVARSSRDFARTSLLSDLVNDRIGSAEEFLRRAGSFDSDLARSRLTALAFRLSATARGKEADELHRRPDLLNLVREALGRSRLSGIVGFYRDYILALVGSAEGGNVQRDIGKTAEEICRRVADRVGSGSVCAGVSRSVPARLARRAVLQALESVDVQARTGDQGSGVQHFGELGLRHLLLSAGDGPHLAQYVETELGPLLDHDAQAERPMLPILRTYLEHDGRLSPSAQALGLDRRVLARRLQRIEDLLGQRLDNPDVRLRLSVAMDALDMLKVTLRS